MNIKLISIGSDLKATEISLPLPILIGRGQSATLILPYPLGSRRHCELYEQDGKLIVHDLGSLNGTFVGSRQVTNAEVPPGELLTVATLSFRIHYGAAQADCPAESPLLLGNDDSTFNAQRPHPASVDADPLSDAIHDGPAQRTTTDPVNRETHLP